VKRDSGIELAKYKG